MAEERDPNPYAPPTHQDDESPSGGGEDGRFQIASRSRRLGGALLDGLVGVAIYVAVKLVMAGGVPTLKEFVDPANRMRSGLGELAPSVLQLSIMGVLIAFRGQSVGKILVLTRIVDETGRRAGLVNGFLLRTLPVAFVTNIPALLLATGSPPETVQPLVSLTSLVALVDVLFIFGPDHRCLHDRIAGTYVAIVGTERSATEGDEPPRPKKKKKRKKIRAESELG